MDARDLIVHLMDSSAVYELIDSGSNGSI